MRATEELLGKRLGFSAVVICDTSHTEGEQMPALSHAPLSAGAAALATLVAVAVLGGGAVSAQSPSSEAAVLEWNGHAVDALANVGTAGIPGAGLNPPVGAVHLAMVQGAVYDAVNMIERTHKPYSAGLPSAPASASKAAAVATAAHDVLVGFTLVPPLSQAIVDRLHGLRNASIAAARTSDGRRAVIAGIRAGRAAAKAMLSKRANDGRFGSFTFAVGSQPGQWRPTPPANVNDPFAWVAQVKPFLATSASQFRSKGPHALTSEAYAREYDEVKALGGNGTTTPSTRTPEQLALARFYVVNPVELYNRTFREIARREDLALAAQARFLAAVNMAGADALITCWADKAQWNFWRPITAIRLGHEDGNPATVGDPAWTPFLVNPPYPEHPSGFNCVTGGFMHAAKAFFGKDRMRFDVTATIGTPPAAVTRSYERFSDVVRDTIDARICQGIHFRASDVQGAVIGKRVARWLDKNFFNRVKRK
jgi:hypothetical protein